MSVVKVGDNYYITISYDSIYEEDKDTSSFTCDFENKIQLDTDKYEIGLAALYTYYSIPNITNGKNNRFTYSIDAGLTWKFIEVPTGCYEIKTLADEIITRFGADSAYFTITPDIATLKCRIKLTTTSQVDFGAENNMGNVLGFNPTIISGLGYHYSDNIVNVQPVNSIDVNINCISHSTINGKSSSSVYGFFPEVSPGFKIIIEKDTPIFLPYTSSSLSQITIQLTDQDNKPVNFRGENVTARFILRRK